LGLLGPGRPGILFEDLLAEVDALVADVDAGTGDQLPDLVLALAAERTAGVPAAVCSVVHWWLDMSLGLGRSRRIMTPEHLVRNADALAADEHTGPRHQPYAALALDLSAERAARLVLGDLGGLAPAEQHAQVFASAFSL